MHTEYLVLRLILVHVLGQENGKACCPVFFCGGILYAICNIPLYLLSESWNMYLIFDGTISFQYLKILVAMKDSTLSETGSQYIF